MDNFSYPLFSNRKMYFENFSVYIDMIQEIVFMDRKEFAKEIAIRCQNNEAALFLGAGMSSNAGLPSWKNSLNLWQEKLELI